MKFVNLLQKELKELINAQMIISLALILIIFMMLGNIMSTTIEEAASQDYSISISDRDDTDFTRQLISVLKENGAEVKTFDSQGDDYPAILKAADIQNLVIIPEGFTAALDAGERPQLISVAKMESAAALSNVSNDNSGVIMFIKQCISSSFAERAGLTGEDIALIDSPVTVSENTVVDNRSAGISVESIMSSVMMKNMLLPVIVFVLIMMTSQGLMSAIANEKIDKTLETLLSAPVSRTAIIGAKMLAAAIVALANAVIYMIGFSSIMGGVTNNITDMVPEQAAEQAGQVIGGMLTTETALSELGLSLSLTDYLLVGVQLFLTIMICLCISIMLGALVNDTKSSQTMIMPLMVMALIPYIISMVSDVNSLPIVLRIIVYAIPFTHTFSAMANLMFGHSVIFFGGLIYQLIVFCICMFFALRLFNSDKILTVSLNFGQKSKFKKAQHTDE